MMFKEVCLVLSMLVVIAGIVTASTGCVFIKKPDGDGVVLKKKPTTLTWQLNCAISQFNIRFHTNVGHKLVVQAGGELLEQEGSMDFSVTLDTLTITIGKLQAGNMKYQLKMWNAGTQIGDSTAKRDHAEL